MKKTVLIIGLSLMTLTAFAQKKEMRKASKAIESGAYAEALTELDAAESQLDGAKEDAKAEFYYLRAKALYHSDPNNLESAKKAIASLKEAGNYSAKSSVRTEMEMLTGEISDGLVTSAIEDQNASNSLSAADKLMEVYKLDEANNAAYLYYAASNYHNAEEIDKALEGYKKLMDIGYTGVEKQYIAEEKGSGEKQVFGDKDQRDLMVKAGTHTNPEDVETEDVSPRILQYMAYIYIQQEDYEDAIKVVDDALKSDPNNTNLLRAKADVLYQLGEKETYKDIMKKVVSLDPNNPELLFNLGVSSAELGEVDEAIDYYNQTLAVDKNHYAANLNTAVLILSKDEEFVTEMNSLGMSTADNKRYQELQEERKELMLEAVPYLENALRIDDSDTEIKRTLANVYSQVGENEKADALLEQIQD